MSRKDAAATATRITERARAPAIGSDGTVYIGSGDGYLYAIGNPSSTITTTSATSSLTAQDGGVPEFPVQRGFTLLTTIVIVASYVLAKRVTISARRT
jgi:outer membrane protein assembly factor BamB